MREQNQLNRFYSTAASFIIISIVILLCACGDKGTSSDAGDQWPEVLKNGHGTLKALYVPAEGFAYPGNQNSLTGVTVELIRDFAGFVSEEYNVDLEIEFEKEEDWSVFYRRIVSGGDGLIGFGNVTITEERKNELAFSPPYMTNIASLITCSDVSEIESMEEIPVNLKGMKALAFEGTLHEKRLREMVENYYPGTEIHLAGSNDEILELVSKNCTYFAYIDIYNYIRASSRGIPLKRHSIADDPAEKFGYIMPLKTTWSEPITRYFTKGGGLTESERYRHIMEKHLGRDLATLLTEQ